MIKKILNFFKTGPDAPRIQAPAEKIKAMYESRRTRVFIGILVGYSVFYVNRLGFSVVKKPLIDSGLLNADQLGKIGSITLIAYAFGKFFNGVLADGFNIRKFLSVGLLITALANLAVGFTSYFWLFCVLWGINGWFQATGAGPCVVSMSQWFGKHERGTLYGYWSSAHGFGEFFTFVCFALIVKHFGWRAGFTSAGVLGVIMAMGLIFLISDRPETYGLPNIKEYKDEKADEADEKPVSLMKMQLQIAKYPAIWILGLASAFNYVTRYGINSWGMLYLQETRHYSLAAAGLTIAVNTIPGVAGAALCGLISDKLFDSNRHKPTLLFGIFQIISLFGFFYAPPNMVWLSVVSLAVYGFALGGTLAYLGGLTAISLVPRKVAGAAMGFIGLISYIGASAQDWLSGHLLQKTATVVNGTTIHNFDKCIIVWVGASFVALILAMTVWNVKNCED